MNHAVLMISEIITTNEPFLLGDLTEISETARHLRTDRTLCDDTGYDIQRAQPRLLGRRRRDPACRGACRKRMIL